MTRIENTLKHPELRPFSWQEQVLPLWRKVALYECLEYFEAMLEDHKLPFNPGEKTHLTISSLLEHHSVSQIFKIIWSSVCQAAAFYQRGGVTLQHSANTVVGRMQSYSERARADNWKINGSWRDRRYPQTVVSKVLFDLTLKIGESGFDTVPHRVMTSNVDQVQDIDVSV